MLKKVCRCGTIINYSEKYCDKCTKEYEDNKKEKNKIYDSKYRKNKEVYKDKKWDKTKEVVINRDKCLCRICLKNKRIKPKDLVHHIIEVEENKKLIYEPSNLVCVCDSCHRETHTIYRRSEQSKKEMQNYLETLIKSNVEL
ncbi:HNH endonuclease [Clostridium senegalense]